MSYLVLGLALYKIDKKHNTQYLDTMLQQLQISNAP